MGNYNVAILVILLLSQKEYSCLTETEVTIHPKSVEVDIGQTITLECQFSNPVYCKWTRNEGGIKISGRYSYTQNENEGTRTDCSIRIELVDNIDLANWKCYGTPSEGNAVDSTPANLKERNRLYVAALNRDETLFLDSNISLVCSGNDDAISNYAWEFRENTNDEDDDWKQLKNSRILQSGLVAEAFRCTARLNEETIHSNTISLKKALFIELESRSSSSPAWFIAFVITNIFWMLMTILLAIYWLLNKKSWTNVKSKIDEDFKLLETGFNNRQRRDTLEAVTDIVDGTKKIISFKKIIKPLQKEHKRKRSQQKTECSWSIKNVRNIMGLHKTTEDMEQMFVTSPSYVVLGTNYSIKLRVYFNGFESGYGSHVSVGIKIENGGGDEIFYHKRTILLIDQTDVSEDKKNHIRFQFEPSLNSFLAEKWMKDWCFTEKFALQSLVQNGNRYINNDTIKLRVTTEPSLLVAAHIDQFCYKKFEWKITNYSREKDRVVKDYQPFLNSKDFYLLPWGHRCQVAVHFTGLGGGYNQGISVYFGFMLGIYEKETPSFFPHTMVFTLLNQDKKKFPEMSDITRTRKVTAENLAETENEKHLEFFRGEHMIACHEQFEKEPYLVNDSIIISIAILPSEGSLTSLLVDS